MFDLYWLMLYWIEDLDIKIKASFMHDIYVHEGANYNQSHKIFSQMVKNGITQSTITLIA